MEVSRHKPELVIALDNTTPNEADVLVDELSSAGVKWFKVGLEMYTQVGPEYVARLKQKGLKVFLDLKLYDIPNTVAKAVKVAVDTGANLLTVHASGGPEMLAAARDAAAQSNLSLLGVTVLTSFGGSSFEEVCKAWGAQSGAGVPRDSVVLRLAELVAHAGLPGIVCSASDLGDRKILKLGWNVERPLFVTPGIRNAQDSKNDQKSVATVEQAVELGSTHLVVGRPITAPAQGSRVQAAKEFLNQIEASYVIASHS